MEQKPKSSSSPVTCENLPSFLSSFVDRFVDFSVSDIFLPQQQQIPPDNKPLQTHYPPPTHLVAIGDLHSDLEKSKQAFRLADLIDDFDHWSGGSTIVVQIKRPPLLINGDGQQVERGISPVAIDDIVTDIIG